MDLFTPAQLAEKYPISRRTLYSAMQDGLLTYFRLPSKKGRRGKYLIDEKDFLAWLGANRHEAGGVEDDGPLTHIR